MCCYPKKKKKKKELGYCPIEAELFQLKCRRETVSLPSAEEDCWEKYDTLAQ